MVDRLKGILFTKEQKCTGSHGELVSIVKSKVFIKGLGGFSGDKIAKTLTFINFPTEKHDILITETIDSI